MVRVQGHGLMPLPKGPCPSFHIPPCVGSLLWKAKLFGFLVYSEVPQTSSSISEPVTNNYSELEASSLPEAEPVSLQLPNQTGRPCLKPVPPVKSGVTNEQRWGGVLLRWKLTIAQGTAPC